MFTTSCRGQIFEAHTTALSAFGLSSSPTQTTAVKNIRAISIGYLLPQKKNQLGAAHLLPVAYCWQ